MSPFITVTIYQGNVRSSIRTYNLRDMAPGGYSCSNRGSNTHAHAFNCGGLVELIKLIEHIKLGGKRYSKRDRNGRKGYSCTKLICASIKFSKN